MIRITAIKAGFRRCGLAHPATPTDYPDHRFTDADLATLMAEPMLVVVRSDDDPEGPPAKARKKGGK